MASSKAWREIWIRPEVRSSRARCPSRRASFVAGSDRTRRTLNCFLLCANPTHANRAPASALARSDRTSSVPSRAGVPHLGGPRRRRLAVRVLLHQADHHLPRLPVRSVPASAPRSLLAGQIFRRVRSSPRASPCGLAARAPRRRAHPARHRARCAFEPRARSTSEHGRAARLTSSPHPLAARSPFHGSARSSPRDAACTRTAAPRASTRASRA